jgi:hypothetical protein
MKRILVRSLIGSGLLIFSGLAAIAQTTPERILHPFYSQDEYQNAHSMFDKIRTDLHQAQTDAYPNDLPNSLRDAPRFDITHNQLRTLEQNWNQGRYDSREFNNTLSAVRMVVNDTHLRSHDRDVLDSDLSRLLEFQAEYY